MSNTRPIYEDTIQAIHRAGGKAFCEAAGEGLFRLRRFDGDPAAGAGARPSGRGHFTV